MPQLIFCDSWDHYNVILNKWDFGGTDCTIDLTGTKSRTGIGCLEVLSAATGPYKIIDSNTTLTVGTAFYTDTACEVMRFLYLATGAQNVRIQVLGDGSIQALTGNSGGVGVTILGTSAVGVYQFNLYNYIEVQVKIAASPNGFVVIKVNGVTALTVTGVKTYAPPIDSGQPFVTGVQLMGPGGIHDGRHDDTYIADWSGDPTDPFYGAIGIYAAAPTADASPLAWTPSAAGTHYTLVDEIPPNANTDYVSSGTVGQVDQYTYNDTGVPSSSQIQAVQHVLDMELDAAGSRSVASNLNGATASTSAALTTAYHMYTTPYDTVPVFPANFGPEVTA